MAQASRASKALIYKKKGTHPMIARMAKKGMHKMPNSKMMSDKKMYA